MLNSAFLACLSLILTESNEFTNLRFGVEIQVRFDGEILSDFSFTRIDLPVFCRL
jgi:hypothetical protein